MSVWKTIFYALTVLLIGACGNQSVETVGETKEVKEAVLESIVKENKVGPVTAKVTFAPKNPALSDSVYLTLEVKAEAGVDVEMPAFGDQLGRFSVSDFKPEREVATDGSVTETQKYTLELPGSGKVRIPSLLIEFVDKRENTQNKQSIDLLTEDFTVEVQSPVTEAEVGSSLKAAKDPLPPLELPELKAKQNYLIPIAASILVLAAIVVFALTRKKKIIVISPYERVTRALETLEVIPDEAEAFDAWFVKLSDALRHYIEDSYSLKAPTLTTEEFFEIIADKVPFGAKSENLLKQILSKSDRVKFANHIPTPQETFMVLEDARDFVERTNAELNETKNG